MNNLITNHIKNRRPLYSSDIYFLFNECSNRFSTNDSVFAFIDNQAHILNEILESTEFQLPIYKMMNVYYYKKASELILSYNNI